MLFMFLGSFIFFKAKIKSSEGKTMSEVEGKCYFFLFERKKPSGKVAFRFCYCVIRVLVLVLQSLPF